MRHYPGITLRPKFLPDQEKGWAPLIEGILQKIEMLADHKHILVLNLQLSLSQRITMKYLLLVES